MSYFTREVTAECFLLAPTAVMNSLDNWAGGSFIWVEFEADIYKSMQNTVLGTCIWDFGQGI